MASQLHLRKTNKNGKKNVLKKHAKLLLHAQSCTSKGQGNCRVTECHEAKRVLKHMNTCKGDNSCRERRCPTYLGILKHWKSCTESSCYLCHPFHNDPAPLEGDNPNNDSMHSSDADTVQSSESDRNRKSQLPNSEPEHDLQIQLVKIEEATSNIQMTNRNILQKLNQIERDEKENQRFLEECNQNLKDLGVKLTQKDQMLDRLVETVLTLQQKLEQLIGLIQTNSVHLLHTPPEAYESKIKVGCVSQGDMGDDEDDDDDNHDNDDDDDDDGDDDDSDDKDSNVKRDRSSIYSNCLSAQPMCLTEDNNKSLTSRNGQTGFCKEAHPTDDTDSYFSLSDISDVMSTGSPDEDTFQTLEGRKQVSVASVNNDLVPYGDTKSSQDEMHSLNMEENESVETHIEAPMERSNVESTAESSDSRSFLQDNNTTSQEKSKKSETNEHKEATTHANESAKYRLPPPMSPRHHQAQNGADTCQELSKIRRDIKGLKRMRTSENFDNRVNSDLNNMVCSNTLSIEKRNRQTDCAPNITASHNDNRVDGKTSLHDQNIRRRGSLDSKSHKSEGFTDQHLSRAGGSKFDLSDLAVESLREDHIDVNTWAFLAENEKRKGTYERRGKGPDTVLCLDISKSMMGENFKTMMLVVKNFIKEIENVSVTKGIQENISIAIFGHETRVLRHLTNDYQKLLRDLDGLTAGGNTPMAGGLLMGLSGCLGNGGGTSIGNTAVHARIILLTDGKVTTDGKLACDAPTGFQDQIRIKEELTAVCEDLRRRQHRVYWVPIGNDSCSTFTDLITSITKGKTIAAVQPLELRRLVKWTQVRCFAVEVANQYPMKGTLEKSVLQNLAASNGITCNTDDLKDLIEECQVKDGFEVDAMDGTHSEFNPHMPKLGTRVKRAPGWMWGNQDSKGIGTVIGHQKNGMLWVEWDNGHKNRYNYHQGGKDVEVTDSPRTLKSFELIATGCLVKRGESWTAGNEDGGPGCVGAVIFVMENGLVGVRWHHGGQGMYKFGSDGCFEVEVCHPSTVTNGRVTSGLTREESNVTPMSESRPMNARKALSVEEMNKRNMQKAAEPIAKWQYLTDENTWIDYSPEQNEKLEKAYKRNKQGSPIVEVNNTVFQVSFQKMTQTNPKTKNAMKIQRLDLTMS